MAAPDGPWVTTAKPPDPRTGLYVDAAEVYSAALRSGYVNDEHVGHDEAVRRMADIISAARRAWSGGGDDA